MIGTAFFPLLTALRRKKINVSLRPSMEIPVLPLEALPRSRPMILRLLTNSVLATNNVKSIRETCVFPHGHNLSQITRNKDCTCTTLYELRALRKHRNSTCREECNQTIQTPVETKNVLVLIPSSLLEGTTARTLKMSQAITNKLLLRTLNSPQIQRYISSKSSTSSKTPKTLLSKRRCIRSWCDSGSAA